MSEKEELGRHTEAMHGAFCDEIRRIFDWNKEYYGWGHKTLRIVQIKSTWIVHPMLLGTLKWIIN
jgi:hypothetical protein